MLAPWLLYVSAIGALLVGIALLLELGARWQQYSARWIWFVAIVAMVAVPVTLNVVRRPTPTPVPTVGRLRAGPHPVLKAASPTRRISLDTPLLILWGTASLLMLARVVAGAALLRHRRRDWETIELDGRPVLLTNDLGPAVVGWARLDTVVPRWALSLDGASREMMLAHEAEHAASGDPYLRTAAIAALVLMPWNPALWYAMRRLRLAVEIDCDHRLLARGVDPHRYASFLLAIGARMAAPPFAWVTALAGPRSSLESRILAMTSPFRPRNPRLMAAALTAGVALLVMVACEGPVPASVLPPAATAVGPARGAPPVQERVEAASLITLDTVMMVDCHKDPACSKPGRIVFFSHESKPVPLSRIRDLAGLDMVQVDTIVRTCAKTNPECANRAEDTVIVLRPKTNEPEFDVESMPDHPTITIRPTAAMLDTLRCDHGRFPKIIDDWLKQKPRMWYRCS
jgi:beta-lactamase regulating signal transducer with metallopeptidase domain